MFDSLVRWVKTQQVRIRYAKYKASYEYIIEEYSGICRCENHTENQDCLLLGALIKELKARGMDFWKNDVVCADLSCYLDSTFHHLKIDLEPGKTCHGQKLLKFIEFQMNRFGAVEEALAVLKSDRCSDGTRKTKSVCQQGWRGPVCDLCPMEG